MTAPSIPSASPALTVRGAVKTFGPLRALDGVDLTVPAGTLLAVLGPSGCGKTTLLRCVAGFEHLDAGEIALGGRTVAAPGTHLVPSRRRAAIVPQEGALFPHRNVADNVAYGLDRAARRSGRVEEVLALVGLEGYQTRMPHQLSGGQQQRVAIARALAPRPPLVLLDEPFTALDASLRVQLRRDVREALRADGASAVLVTHDQDEALSMANEVAVLRAGRIVQVDTPAELYARPADAWVAGFVGEAVLLPGEATDGRARTRLGEIVLDNGVGEDAAAGLVTVLIRPEQIALTPVSASDAAGSHEPGVAEDVRARDLSARIVARDFHGHDTLVTLALTDGADSAGPVVRARVQGHGTGVQVGDRVTAQVVGPVLAWPDPTA